MSSNYHDEADRSLRNFLIGCAVVVVAFIIFAVTVIGPSHDRIREACDERGGIVVRGGACVQPA